MIEYRVKYESQYLWTIISQQVQNFLNPCNLEKSFLKTQQTFIEAPIAEVVLEEKDKRWNNDVKENCCRACSPAVNGCTHCERIIISLTTPERAITLLRHVAIT